MAILPGTRIRDNGVFGTTTDNPLTAGATTFNSARLADLSTVAGNHALVTLDPLRQFGNPEIVMVTAHTAAATVATIQRGMFGTTARSHVQGTLWVHAAADNDFIEIVTSGTRPADQYEGQFIFETDTNKLVGFGGVDWAPRDSGGQIGYTETTSNQAFDAETTLVSSVVTVGTGRRIKITGDFGRCSHTNAGATGIYRIKEGATVLNRKDLAVVAAGNGAGVTFSVVLTPSAGGHTYSITAESLGADASNTNAGAGQPVYILVEDIGAA